MVNQRRKSQNSKTANIWKWLVGIVIVFVLGVSGISFSMYNSFKSNIEKTHVNINRDLSKQRIEKVNFERKDPFSILILGIDGRSGEIGRSDTIVVITVNPNSKDTKMLSIPRDTYTEIVGRHSRDKLNHAYAFGGMRMSMDSVEHLLNIPIDYVGEINMDGFSDMIDAVGGITVNSTRAFDQNGYHFQKGTNKLNGKSALAYVRNRHDDPEGDFGRQERQRQLISGIIQRASSMDGLLNYHDIFKSLGNNV